MAFVDETIANLVAQGFFDYVLPFLLAFFVIYAILQQAKILGGKPGIDAIVSMILGLFVLYFARVYQVGRFLSIFSGKGFLTIIVLMFTLMITMFVYNVMKNATDFIRKGEEWKYGLVIFGGAVLLVVFALNSSPNTWQILFGADFNIDNNALVTVGVVAGLVGLVAIIMSKGDDKPNGS